MKKILLPISLEKYLEARDWVENLPSIKETDEPSYTFSKSGLSVLFENECDAVAFRLRFGI